MLSKREIKDIQSLSQKKFRKELKLFVAEGPKIVSELAALVPDQIQAIYATEDWKPGIKIPTELRTVGQAELERISGLQTPNQVLAVLKTFETTAPPDEGLTLYLDGIQDPGNFGTIIRTADWFGVHHIVCGEGCADLYNSKVVQSTMASIARVNVFYEEASGWLGSQKRSIYAATLQGRPLTAYKAISSGILVIGNESKGISEPVMQLASEKITIPRVGKAESLNAAVATGILLSHLVS